MSKSLQHVRVGYDRWSKVYDHDLNPLPALEAPYVHAALGNVEGLSVLDMGCGTGRHALWCAEQGAKVTAVDFSAGMLAETRQKPFSERVRFLQHDLHEPLPFGDARFDIVVSGLVLEHIRDLDSFFSEARRVLQPQGRAVISAMHPAMFLRGSQARFTDPDSGELVQPGSIAHTISDFVMAAVRGGFQIETIGEHAPDVAFAQAYQRAEKYIDWPMLVVMSLKPLAA
jgi:ubiquinone/menaquinone biosynthesis C-methylase UbiE